MTKSELLQLHPGQSADVFVLLYSGAKYFAA
jgi:hypothetical protein